MLDVRNILVHEIPAEKPCEIEEISVFIDSAKEFMHAAEEHFASPAYGDYPLTQGEMNHQAAEEHASALGELAAVCRTIHEVTNTSEIYDVQVLWNAFKEAEAERQAQRHLGGSIRPMLYSMSAANITKARIKELQRWLENPGD